MLITLCYSVLTWMQSRQRTEIVGWIQECLVKEKGSVVFIRDRILLASPRKGVSPTFDNLLDQSMMSQSSSGYGLSSSVNRSESFSSSVGGGGADSPGRNLSRSSSNVSGGSNYSTPKKEVPGSSQYDGETHLAVLSPNKSNTSRSSTSSSHYGSIRQISDLCYNHSTVRLRRLLWEEDRARAIVLMPQQIVDLHDWTAFVDSDAEISNQVDIRKFYILFEAEPGLTQRVYYRKFTQFGRIVSWKCGPSDLALILYSDWNQLVELMHIFRLGQIVLEGGWRVYRLTTCNIEGSVGTLISRGELAGKTSLTPADLRRLSAGLYESRNCTTDNSAATSVTGTPKTFVSVSDSQDISKHDITTIDEEALEDSQLDLTVKLPNWYERSPRKRSVATINFAEKTPLHQLGPRRRSFCPGSLGSLPNKSGSLASLLMCTKSLSLDEDSLEPPARRNTESEGKSRTLPPNTLRTSGAPTRSADSLGKSSSKTASSSGAGTPSHLLSPCTNADMSLGSPGAMDITASPRRLPKKSPKRIGKPPNILILCENEQRRSEITLVLKAMLANDRYAIYDIRWDQLGVGGWSEQTALLVVSGKIPDKKGESFLLQYLGDGGRLLSWCCESPPFGPEPSPASSATKASIQKKIIQHGPAEKVTHALAISDRVWGAAGNNQPPPGFQRVLETSDSEGYSRPMTVSAYGRLKDTNQTCIVQLDGGALGGKAILSQIHFEKCVDESDSLALLSLLLSQNLGIDCTQIKAPEYTIGYLLGDHKKVVDFLTSNPSTVQQAADLTVEFIPRGEKGSLPSHLRFPIRVLECPQNFSTVEYYENLTTKEIGRLVIYTDVITSTMNVINGHFLRHGLVVIAARQTSGRGRGKNVWLSPEGCACFSIQLSIDLDSAMGRRISLLQHIAGLAVVRSIPNHKEIGLRVKWPNDIYVNDTKIGGILVESSISDRKITVNMGMGINVINAYPTVSLNSVLEENNVNNAPATSSSSYAKGTKKDKPLCSIEKVIARVLSEFENLLEDMDSNNIDKILNLYTDNWVHGSLEDDSEENIVNVEVSGGNFAECRIAGIDQFGFLRVKEIKSGHVFSVRPDGNSFDIANKLIAIKQ